MACHNASCFEAAWPVQKASMGQYKSPSEGVGSSPMLMDSASIENGRNVDNSEQIRSVRLKRVFSRQSSSCASVATKIALTGRTQDNKV